MSFLIRPARAGDENAIAEQLVKIHDLHAQGRPDLFAGGAPKCDAAKVRALFDDPQTPVLTSSSALSRDMVIFSPLSGKIKIRSFLILPRCILTIFS